MAPKMLAEWFWADRWMGSSAFLLPMEARGLYREMLTQAWRRGAALPNDHDQIQRATGCTAAEWRRSWPKIERFWVVRGDLLVNETQVEVYKEALQREEAKSNRGKAGAAARWADAQGDAQADAQASSEALPTQCPPSPSLIYEEHKERTAPPAPRKPKSSDWKRAVAIAHKAIEAYPGSMADQSEAFKTLCGQQGIDYGAMKDGQALYVRALDYTAGARKRRRTH